MDAHVTVAIPTRCSSLSKIPDRIDGFRAGFISGNYDFVVSQLKKQHAAKKRRRDNAATSTSPLPAPPKHQAHKCLLLGVLTLQCLLDRIVWNEFCPMISESYSGRPKRHRALYRAVLILMRHFRHSIRPICFDEPFVVDLDTPDMMSVSGTDGANTGSSTADIIGCERDEIARGFYYERHIHVFNKKRVKMRTLHVLLFILPPYPYDDAAASCSLRPEKIFTSRLVKLENIMVRLQSLNAFFSTLGGGYFLCRYLSIAVRLARSQRAIALSLGDRNLAARCTVNEAYNYIHAGRIRHALMLLKQVQGAAVERGDNLTISMCKSARLFAKRVRKANAFEGTKQSVDDELQRIRIVKDDSKINRTFRPLQEL